MGTFITRELKTVQSLDTPTAASVQRTCRPCRQLHPCTQIVYSTATRTRNKYHTEYGQHRSCAAIGCSCEIIPDRE